MRMEAAELRDCGRLKDIRAFIDELYANDLHAKRVDSLAADTPAILILIFLSVAERCRIFGSTMDVIVVGGAHGGIGGGFANARVSSRSCHDGKVRYAVMAASLLKKL